MEPGYRFTDKYVVYTRLCTNKSAPISLQFWQPSIFQTKTQSALHYKVLPSGSFQSRTGEAYFFWQVACIMYKQMLHLADINGTDTLPRED